MAEKRDFKKIFSYKKLIFSELTTCSFDSYGSYLCIYLHIYIYRYIHMYVHTISSCTYTHTHTHIYIYIYIYTCMSVCFYTRVKTLTHKCFILTSWRWLRVYIVDKRTYKYGTLVEPYWQDKAKVYEGKFLQYHFFFPEILNWLVWNWTWTCTVTAWRVAKRTLRVISSNMLLEAG
jgi:hypothetical protein